MSQYTKAQNWNQIIKAAASDRAPGDEFGRSVAISGDYAIVGASEEGEDAAGANTPNDAGCAYIFKRIGATWVQEAKIVASDKAGREYFGTSVAISGDYVIVGAFGEDEDAAGGNTLNDAGSAYIFKRTGTTWAQEAKIVASDRAVYDFFGWSVAISGDYAIIGAFLEEEDVSGANTMYRAGSAYIFKRIGTTWTQEAKIVSSDRAAQDDFGYSVAISGDYAIVGARTESEDAAGANTLNYAGSAYIFKRTGTTWAQESKIVSSDRAEGDGFGHTVAISGDYAILGTSAEDEDAVGTNTLNEAGSAYIFKRTGTTWAQEAKIVASDRAEGDQLGYSVAISGDYAIVGAIREGDIVPDTLNYGSAYIFKRTGTTWAQEAKMVASDRADRDLFGFSVAISGDYALVGAIAESEDAAGGNTLGGAGSAYFFKSCPTVTITCPVTATTNYNTNAGLCTYSVAGNVFNATATDNCGATGLTYVLSGATTGTGSSLAGVKLYIGTTTVTWTAQDAANNTKTCSFTVVVKDVQNATDFIIYATEEAVFGQHNYIGGNVGVTAATGTAVFAKNTVLDPYSVKAKNISVSLPSNVINTTNTPATGGPNPPFYPYSNSISGLSNIDITVNGTTLNGNYKNVKVENNITATINGNNFGKITIEKGANVTFTASIINMEELKVEKGDKNVSITVVNFSNPTSVIVEKKVSVEADADVNVGGPKVTFYLGDFNNDKENFEVNGDNTRVTANIMIPNGKLTVEGGGSTASSTIMTGWYIIEKLDAKGNYTYWNKYDCSMPTVPSSSEKVTADIRVHTEYERNVLSFVTSQGLKTDYWTAEKMNNITGNFQTLAIQNNIKPKEALQYLTFYDYSPSEGDNFYRIKRTFINGEEAYSAVVKLNNPKTNDFAIYPNPADEEVWIDLKSFEGRQVTLVLSDMVGKTVQQQVIQKAIAAPYRIDVSDLPTGLYLIKVQPQGKRVFMRKLQVAR